MSVNKILRLICLTAGYISASSGRIVGEEVRKTPDSPAVLDIVVRDQAGAAVQDLKPEEIEIIDNRIKQDLKSFEIDPASNGPRFVTMVFGGLTNAGREFARQAAADLLKLKPHNVLISVFVIDRRLYALEPFNADTDTLQESVKLATAGSFEKFLKTSEKMSKDLSKMKDTADPNRVIAAALERAAKTQKEDWTYAALDALNILVEELGKLPERKMVIFFSEGLVIQDVMLNRFKFLVSAANLANAPVYTVDSRGLLTSGITQGAKDLLSSASSASQSQFGAASTSSSQVRALEDASQSVRMNVQEALANLSAQTGGFLIANTNDSLPGVRKIIEELTGFYRLKYTPDRKGDGTFREVAVKVARPNLTVQSPSGYFDLPSAAGREVASYEVPLLSLLSKAEISNPFGLHGRLFRFEAKADGIQHTFAMLTPLRHFTFAPNEKEKVYSTHFSLMGLLKDSSGQVVEKFSQDYPLQGPLGKMEGVKNGSVLFLRNFSAVPGNYTLEIAALDHPTATASALRIPVTVEGYANALSLSDLIVIDRADPISDQGKERGNPLRYQDKKIAPNMGAPLVKDPNSQLGIYCVVYPSSKINAQPKLAVLFFKDGQPLFKGEPPLQEPDENGHVKVVLNLPLANFQPGNYQVIAVVQQGDATAERKAAFSVVQ